VVVYFCSTLRSLHHVDMSVLPMFHRCLHLYIEREGQVSVHACFHLTYIYICMYVCILSWACKDSGQENVIRLSLFDNFSLRTVPVGPDKA
jgi:hypothetical protein